MATTDKTEFHQGFTKRVPPGCLYRHQKSGGWYWKVPASHAPLEVAAGKRTLYLPMVPTKRRYATKAKGLAEACQKLLWAQWLRETNRQIDTPGMTELLDEYEQRNRLRASARHAAANRRMLQRFLAGQEITEPHEITEQHVAEHLAAMQAAGRAAATMMAHKHTIGAFCKFLRRRGYIDADPTEDIDLARPAKRPPRYLSDDQVSMLLIAAYRSPHDWLFDAISFGLYAGLRVGEIAALRWRDIGESITVGASKPTKTGDYRYVPIRPALAVVIGAMKRTDGLVFPKHHSVYWGQVMAELTGPLPVFGELGGRRVGNQWHLLRSTYAVNRAREGATLWQLMAELGHTDPKTTMRYVNVARAGGGQ